MDITPKLADSSTRIRRYGGGQIWVGEQGFAGLVRITAERAETLSAEIDAEPARWLESYRSHLPDCEILLLGCGAASAFIAPALREQVKAQCGATIEAMDSGAACRTYNVLLAEGRQVAALIQAI